MNWLISFINHIINMQSVLKIVVLYTIDLELRSYAAVHCNLLLYTCNIR